MWKCSKCGADVSQNEEVCPTCGEACPEETESTWICENCGAECVEDECPSCGEIKPQDLSETDGAPKKKTKIYGFVIAVSAAVILTIGIFIYFFFNAGLEKTGNTEENLITYKDIENSMDLIFDDDIALKIDGVEVSANVFDCIVSQCAILYQREYCNGDISKLDGFKWTDKAENGKNTHREEVIANAVNYSNAIYSAIALGNEFDIEPSQVDLEAVDELIYQYEDEYGDDLNEVLSLSGFKNVEQFKEYSIVHARYSAAVADMEANPDRYIGKDVSIYDTKKPEAVYVKTIALAPAMDMESVKKEAEKIIKEVNDDNFDKLIRKYDESGSNDRKPTMISKGLLSMSMPDMAEFEETALKLKMNEVSKPVETARGVFILKRVVTINDVLDYAAKKSRIIVNKSLIKDIKVRADYKKAYEKELESAAQQKLYEEMMEYEEQLSSEEME